MASAVTAEFIQVICAALLVLMGTASAETAALAGHRGRRRHLLMAGNRYAAMSSFTANDNLEIIVNPSFKQARELTEGLARYIFWPADETIKFQVTAWSQPCVWRRE